MTTLPLYTIDVFRDGPKTLSFVLTTHAPPPSRTTLVERGILPRAKLAELLSMLDATPDTKHSEATS